MWDYAIGVLKLVLCFMVAWGLKNSSMALPVACVCLAIIGVIATRKIYEKG
jgi:uncharacterized membrane protein YphA (DoxX/SURF4 family)